MSKAFSNLLKYIDKLPHTKKEQVYQRVKMTDTYDSLRLSKFSV